MMELLHDMIVNMTPWFAIMVGGVGVGSAVVVATYLNVKPNKLGHTENMAKIEAQHRETMLKLNRENPQLVGGVGNNKAIEHDRNNG